MIGSVLVILIIFLFLRSPRSTLIVATSIPISVVGTFALLYFAGMTLNTMTFGGLALGVGMVVDAAIVVLENSYRHMEHHGKDRLTASIDGSEEVWSAILASILTHIAVFVPLLFLTGVSSVMFRQLSVVVCFSLAMSLFVAVTLVPVLCSKLLKLPPPMDQRKGVFGQVVRLQRAGARAHGRRLPPAAAQVAESSSDRRRPRRGLGRRRGGDLPDAADRVHDADRRGTGQRERGAGAGNPDRNHRSGAATDRGLARSARARSDDDHRPGRRWRRQFPGRRRRRRRESRQHQHHVDAEGRADAVERADRPGSAAPASRHSRRGRPREPGGRQSGPHSPALGRRQQRRRPALAGDSRRRSRRVEETRPDP